MPLERLLECHRFGLLDGEFHSLIRDFSAVGCHDFFEQAESGFIACGQRNVGVGEVDVLAPVDGRFPEVGQLFVSVNHTEDTSGSGGIAVAVLTAAGGDVHGAEEIAFAVEQADYAVGGIDCCIDVEAVPHPFGATFLVGVFLVDGQPALFPVGGVLAPEVDYIGYAAVEIGFLGNGAESLLHDGGDIVAYICQGVESAYVDAAIEAVAIVHDVADFVGDAGS